MGQLDLMDPFQGAVIPVGDWAAAMIKWIVINFRGFFQEVKQPIDFMLTYTESGLHACPPLVFIAALFLFTWQVAEIRTALFVAVCLFAIGLIGAWPEAMTTLAIVLTAVVFCCAVGIPVGIMAAQNATAEKILRPILDFMQTIPSFVYLVPVVMLFGIGNVSGVIVTIIYALAPVIRLTALGIRQVRTDHVEASTAFGGSTLQTLLKVQLPLARPTIMTGVNQTVMLSLSMSVIASMISVTGLGQMVLRGIGRLDIALATTGGLGIVFTAMVVDRISQGLGGSRRWETKGVWWEVGPIGLVKHGMRTILGATARAERQISQ